jgi:hypothetical protein
MNDYHVSLYTTPKLIPIHPSFTRRPDDKAWVIIRENYGVVGLKDALKKRS